MTLPTSFNLDLDHSTNCQIPLCDECECLITISHLNNQIFIYQKHFYKSTLSFGVITKLKLKTFLLPNIIKEHTQIKLCCDYNILVSYKQMQIVGKCKNLYDTDSGTR